MSLLNRPDWKERILPLLKVEIYGRDGQGRMRVEARSTLTPAQREYLLGLRCRCAKCGTEIAPFRDRRPAGWAIYYAASCRLEDRVACSRSKESSAEYNRVAYAVLEHAGPSPQLEFFR